MLVEQKPLMWSPEHLALVEMIFLLQSLITPIFVVPRALPANLMSLGELYW